MTSPRQQDPPPVGGIAFRHEATAADARLVREIVASTGMFNPAELHIAVELVEERLERGATSGYHFIFAEVGGEPCGYGCFGPIDGTASSYDLYWIAVHQDRKKQGIGKAILAEVERRIGRGVGRRVYVETSDRPDYAPTRSFYQRCGYRKEAELADFYAPGDSNLVYVKVL